MQYYEAVRIGQQRAAKAQEVLARYSGGALAAMIVKRGKQGEWLPVGEENLLAIVAPFEDKPAMVAVCDIDGYSKALTRQMSKREAQQLFDRMLGEGFEGYGGEPKIPI